MKKVTAVMKSEQSAFMSKWNMKTAGPRGRSGFKLESSDNFQECPRGAVQVHVPGCRLGQTSGSARRRPLSSGRSFLLGLQDSRDPAKCNLITLSCSVMASCAAADA